VCSLLCQAFEVYHDPVADPRISFENLVFPVGAITEGQELALAACEDCGALTVVDRITFIVSPPLGLPAYLQRSRRRWSLER
jgi:hypothetical protein